MYRQIGREVGKLNSEEISTKQAGIEIYFRLSQGRRRKAKVGKGFGLGDSFNQKGWQGES